MALSLELELLSGEYAVSRLAPEAGVPDWAFGEGCVNVTVAEDEISVTCVADRVPEDVEYSAGWAAIKVSTKFEFDEAGVVLAAIRPISEAGFGVFVVSTFYRDYLLVRQAELERVRALLVDAGHSFRDIPA